jgi:hypothetical protein
MTRKTTVVPQFLVVRIDPYRENAVIDKSGRIGGVSVVVAVARDGDGRKAYRASIAAPRRQ